MTTKAAPDGTVGSDPTGPVLLGDDADRVIGDNVRTYRKAAGLTQRELAERLGALGWPVDNSAVARIEAGERALRAGQVVLIARALGRPVQDLFEADRISQANLALSGVMHRLILVEGAVLDLLEAEEELRARLESMKAAEWPSRERAEELLSLPVVTLVAAVVADHAEAPGSTGVRVPDGRRRDPRTFSGSEMHRQVDRYLTVQTEARGDPDGQHQEAP